MQPLTSPHFPLTPTPHPLGSNALHVTLDSSRDMGTARFLLEQNVDGFAFNQAGRSPLSISIECLPELALFLLKEKSRFEYRWWGDGLEP